MNEPTITHEEMAERFEVLGEALAHMQECIAPDNRETRDARFWVHLLNVARDLDAGWDACSPHRLGDPQLKADIIRLDSEQNPSAALMDMLRAISAGEVPVVEF